jgi:hypothetical protein
MRHSARGDRDRDFGEGELDLAIREGGCPACTLAGQTEEAVLGWLVRENLRDPQTVANMARSGGLCGPHWSAVLRRADARTGRRIGRALVAVADLAVERLPEATGEGRPRCPVCASMDRRARGAVEMVLGRLDDSETRAEFAGSFGLCQPHASVGLQLETSAKRRRAFIQIQARQLRRLRDDVEAAIGEHAVRTAAHALAAKLAGTLGGSPATGGLH